MSLCTSGAFSICALHVAAPRPVHYREVLEAVQRRTAAGDFNLGNALFLLGDRAGAERCYRAALAADPDYPRAVFTLAVTLATFAAVTITVTVIHSTIAGSTARKETSAEPITTRRGILLHLLGQILSNAL